MNELLREKLELDAQEARYYEDYLADKAYCPECGSYYEDDDEFVCGICRDCFDDLITVENALAWGKELNKDAKGYDLMYEFIATCFEREEIIKIVEDALKARLASGYAPDVKRFNKAAKRFIDGTCEFDFVKFMTGGN